MFYLVLPEGLHTTVGLPVTYLLFILTHIYFKALFFLHTGLQIKHKFSKD